MPEQETLESLYDKYAPAIYSYAMTIVKDPATAEDVLQSVFVAVCENDPRQKPIQNMRSWLLRVAHNQALNIIRERQRFSDDSDLALLCQQTCMEESSIYSMEVRRALAKLEPLEQQLFTLHYVSGYRYRELAGMLGLPIGTVKTVCHRAKVKLARYLKSFA